MVPHMFCFQVTVACLLSVFIVDEDAFFTHLLSEER